MRLPDVRADRITELAARKKGSFWGTLATKDQVGALRGLGRRGQQRARPADQAECSACDDHEVIETTKDTKITKTLFLFVFFVPSWLNSGRGYRELVAVEGFSAISVLVSVPRPS